MEPRIQYHYRQYTVCKKARKKVRKNTGRYVRRYARRHKDEGTVNAKYITESNSHHVKLSGSYHMSSANSVNLRHTGDLVKISG